MNLSGSTESLFEFIKGLNSKVSSETFLGVNKGQKCHEKTYLYHINVTCAFMIFVPRVHVTLTLPIAMPLETLISQQIILFFRNMSKWRENNKRLRICRVYSVCLTTTETRQIKKMHTQKKLLEHFKSSFLIKKRQKKRSNWEILHNVERHSSTKKRIFYSSCKKLSIYTDDLVNGR